MGTETELKLKVDDHEPIRERLRSIGALRRGVRFEINAFFDADGKLKAAGNGLRLRSMRDEAGVTRSVITFKGPATGDAVRSREEIEFSIGDFDAASTLLERLGYLPTHAFEKRRETWEVEGCLVELDELPHLGTFLEVEGDSARHVEAALERRGLIDRPAVMQGYASMVGALLRERPELGTALRFT